MALRVSRESLFQHTQLFLAQFAMRYPFDLVIQQDHLPVIARQYLMARLDLR